MEFTPHMNNARNSTVGAKVRASERVNAKHTHKKENQKHQKQQQQLRRKQQKELERDIDEQQQ